MWRHKRVQFKVDNAAVVSICQTGFTRDCNLAALIRNIWIVTAQYDIDLQVTHIAGRQNVTADLF